MESYHKKILLNIAYYTLIGLGFLSCVLFILKVAFSNLPLYLKIIYFIWCGFVILYLCFDVFCTIKRMLKFVAGIILFVLSLISVVLAVNVFIVQGISFRSVTNLEVTYFINMSLSFLPIFLSFFAFIVGEKIIEY